MFTEGYQVEAMKGYYPVFNKYRGKNLIGEMIWNFADFSTAQGTVTIDLIFLHVEYFMRILMK